jgi:hypothetical protein
MSLPSCSEIGFLDHRNTNSLCLKKYGWSSTGVSFFFPPRVLFFLFAELKAEAHGFEQNFRVLTLWLPRTSKSTLQFKHVTVPPGFSCARLPFEHSFEQNRWALNFTRGVLFPLAKKDPQNSHFLSPSETTVFTDAPQIHF